MFSISKVQISRKSLLPKGLGEFLGSDGFVAMLQLVEDPLQGQGHALGRVVSLCGHHVHRLGGEGVATFC